MPTGTVIRPDITSIVGCSTFKVFEGRSNFGHPMGNEKAMCFTFFVFGGATKFDMSSAASRSNVFHQVFQLSPGLTSPNYCVLPGFPGFPGFFKLCHVLIPHSLKKPGKPGKPGKTQ